MIKEPFIKVKVTYRHYRPLHSMFAALVECPPAGVEYYIPKPSQHGRLFSIMYKAYNKFGDHSISQWLISSAIDPLIFGAKGDRSDRHEVDLIHFINMVPSKLLGQPYVVEFEHIGALTGFTTNKSAARKVRERLTDDYCKAIICSSYAAKLTVEHFFGEDFSSVSAKVSVIYPGVCKKDIKFTKRHSDLHTNYRLLFVGNLCYRKGLEEILLALEKLPSRMSNYHLEIVSNDADKLVNEHPNLASRVKLYQPKYSKKEILDDFYSKADVFILPTKGDTFGFALVDALTCGVPVISTKLFAIPEIIDDGGDGALLELSNFYIDYTSSVTRKMTKQSMASSPDLKLVEQLTTCLTALLDNDYDLERMSEKALMKVKPGGKFSESERNRKLADIYKTALS